MLFEQESEVRAQAAKVLGDRRLDKAAPDLKTLLADRDPRVKFFAAQALGQMKSKAATAPILAISKAGRRHSTNSPHTAYTLRML